MTESNAASGHFALATRFPAAASRLPRISLTELPTRVHRLENLERIHGLGPLWVKRDDESGRLYGGNKPRKLELLLGRAKARGRHTVLTFGGIGTHHGLATTICARAAGLRTTLILIPQPVTDHVRHCLLLDHAYGARMLLAPNVPGVVAKALGLYARGLFGDWPEMIPTGGTSALGTVGYINAALELEDQVRSGELPEPDWIFAPLGSGGTVAGLVAGLKLTSLKTKVISVLVTDILPPGPRRLTSLASAALRVLRRHGGEHSAVQLGPGDFPIVRDFIGASYGSPTAEGQEAKQEIFEHEGISLETTYSAKCLAALLRLAGEAPYRGSTILFWNTYSSVDLLAGISRLPDPRELPPEFHQFF